MLSIKSYWPGARSYSSFAGVGGIFLIGAGSLATGVILMIVTRLTMPRFFTVGTLPPAAGEQSPVPVVPVVPAAEVAA